MSNTFSFSYGDFQAYCRANSKKNKLYISKPENGCQGKGIFIFKNPKEIRPGEHAVVQQYISRVIIYVVQVCDLEPVRCMYSVWM